MSVAERHLDSTYASDDLAFAIEQVGVGNYADALQALARAKADDPRNIFLIALEKQVMRLRNGGILPREKVEIVESLPGLAERARADHGSRTPASEPSSSQQAPLPAPGDRKDPRLKMVVEQYFRHADEWVRKRDFEAALKEIERVLLIDPGNRVAKEYQSRIQQLFRIEHHEDNDTASPPAAAAAVFASDAPAEKKIGKPVVFISIGIAAIVMVIVGVMFLRPSKGQYRVGYMYVTQPQAQAEEDQGAAGATVANDPGVQEAVADNAPEVTPPEVTPPEAKPREEVAAKAPSRSSLKSDVKEGKKAESDVKEGKKAESAPPRVEPPASAPLKSSPTAPTPSAIGEKDRSREEPAAPARFIPVEQPPKIVQLEQPSFSDDQMAKGIQGDIVVKVQIDKTGKPLQAKVISSTNPSLDAVVMDAVMRSSYSPGVMSSGPVTTWMTIPLKLK